MIEVSIDQGGKDEYHMTAWVLWIFDISGSTSLGIQYSVMSAGEFSTDLKFLTNVPHLEMIDSDSLNVIIQPSEHA